MHWLGQTYSTHCLVPGYKIQLHNLRRYNFLDWDSSMNEPLLGLVTWSEKSATVTVKIEKTNHKWPIFWPSLWLPITQPCLSNGKSKKAILERSVGNDEASNSKCYSHCVRKARQSPKSPENFSGLANCTGKPEQNSDMGICERLVVSVRVAVGAQREESRSLTAAKSPSCRSVTRIKCSCNCLMNSSSSRSHRPWLWIAVCTGSESWESIVARL